MTRNDFFRYSQNSSIVVIDIAKDEIVDVLNAPCPDIDHATADDDGNLYFSAWIFAPGGAATGLAPSTCVAKIAMGEDTVSRAFDVRDVEGGHEGGVFRYVGNGKAVLSVLHEDRVTGDDAKDPTVVAYGPNWHFWSYDLETEKAEEITTIDWNAGAAYASTVDGKSYALVPNGGYTSTTLYDFSTPAEAKSIFDGDGWVIRLQKLR